MKSRAGGLVIAIAACTSHHARETEPRTFVCATGTERVEVDPKCVEGAPANVVACPLERITMCGITAEFDARVYACNRDGKVNGMIVFVGTRQPLEILGECIDDLADGEWEYKRDGRVTKRVRYQRGQVQ